MMMNKRLIGMVPESRKYVAACVAIQRGSLVVNVAAMTAAARTLAALDEYARNRSDRCPFMETQTFCANCRVHCCKLEMRAQIREVMRYSGPRMMLHHPVMAVRHVIETQKEKKKLEA